MTQFLEPSPPNSPPATISPATGLQGSERAPAITPAAAVPHEFLQVVDGVYRTAPRHISWFVRAFPSLAFYPTFTSVVIRGSWNAKHGRYDSRDWSQSSFDVLRGLERVGCRFEITGVDHIERVGGPCVIAGNHMSTLETAVLPVVIQPIREVTFVVKQSLVDYPVFKHIMRSRNPIAVSQRNARDDLKATLVEGAERLGRGVSVVVFPEGSRLAAFSPERFNTIAVKLAGRAGVPVVPVALLTDAWAVGKRIPDLGRIYPERKIRIAFGEPMTVEGRGIAQQQALVEFILCKLAAWKAEDVR